MKNEHGVTLLQTDMQEIKNIILELENHEMENWEKIRHHLTEARNEAIKMGQAKLANAIARAGDEFQKQKLKATGTY